MQLLFILVVTLYLLPGSQHAVSVTCLSHLIPSDTLSHCSFKFILIISYHHARVYGRVFYLQNFRLKLCVYFSFFTYLYTERVTFLPQHICFYPIFNDILSVFCSHILSQSYGPTIRNDKDNR